jgi:hypothetical protein
MWNLVLVYLVAALVPVYFEMVLVSVQDRFAPNIPKAQKSFWTHPMVLLGDEAQMQARFVSFGDNVILDARKVHGLR